MTTYRVNRASDSVTATDGQVSVYDDATGTWVPQDPTGGGGGGGGVPIFGSQAEAQAWEAANPGKVALWFDALANLTPVTPTGPTWTDDAVNGGGTWTTPAQTGVTYSPASGTATPGQTVTVTATAQTGYVLQGTTTWTHTFPADPNEPVGDDYFTDFSGASVGSAPPAGWTPKWVSGTWAVVDDGAGGKRLSGAATSRNTRCGLAWDDPVTTATEADVQIVARWSAPESSAQGRLILRGAGAAGAETGVIVYVSSADKLTIAQYSGGSASPIHEVLTLTTEGEDYLIRFEAVGTLVRAKIWKYGDPEPEAWAAQGTTTVTGPGWAGVMAFYDAPTTYSLVGVNTGGGTAPLGG